MTSRSLTEQDRTHSSEIEQIYQEMRREIEILGKAESGDPNDATRFPDPAALDAVGRRVLIKSIFSFVEALAYAMKIFALEASGAAKLTPGERMLALEETYELSASGDVESRRAKLRTLSNVRFAFGILAKVHSVDFRLDASGKGWQALQRSGKVRDRLMHPKALEDLNVSDVEARDALRAFIWFESQIIITLSTIVRSQEATITSLKKAIFELRGVSEAAGSIASVAHEGAQHEGAVDETHDLAPLGTTPTADR